jgi:hypothetical protein
MSELLCVDEGMGKLRVLTNSIVTKEEEGHYGICTMYFDFSHSKIGTSCGIVLVSPKSIHAFFSYRI